MRAIGTQYFVPECNNSKESDVGESFLETLTRYSSTDGETCGNGTDKNTVHCYGPVYEEIITPLQSRFALKVLEIGIWSGAFLACLAEFLPHAEIYGIDISLDHLKFGRDHPRIRTLKMDATSPGAAEVLGQTWDVIIEDGSHEPLDQIKTLDMFAPYLRPGGIYVLEDINGKNEMLLNALRRDLERVATKHSLSMEWIDLRHKKGRFDDILAVFRRTMQT